jgi:TolB protein
MFRRTLLRLLVVLTGLVAFLPQAWALVEININKGNVEPLPIAVTDFIASGDLGQRITDVIAADLKRSGLFAPVNKQAFIEKISNPDQQPRFEDWKVMSSTRRRS